MRDFIKKYRHGDSLTDVECRHLHRFFSEMEDNCDILGTEYNLFKNEMRKGRQQLETWLAMRGIDVR